MISLKEALNAGRVPFARWASSGSDASAKQDTARDVVVQGDFRKEVIGPAGRELGDYADELGRALREHEIFLLNDVVVELQNGRDLVPFRPERFCGWVELYVALRKWEKVDDEMTLTPSPMGAQTAAKILVAPQFHRNLRRIRRVSQVPLPVWSADGAGVELLPAGYCEQHETFVVENIALDETISPADAAAWLTKEVFGEFPLWKEDYWRSMSTIMAMVLMPFCELLVPEGVQRPAFIVTANAEGSGKTLLVQHAICPIHGEVAVTAPPVNKESETMEKKLKALVFSGAPYIFIDNWQGEIGGAAIEGFCTARVMKDRMLGSDDVKSAKKNTLLFITGNRAKVSPDMRRRSLVIELFVEETQAEMRQLKRWIDENGIFAMRKELLSAYWALVKDWAAQSPRPGSSIRHGTFAAWSDVVCAIVEAAGLPSPLSPPRLRESLDPDLEAFEVLLPCILDERQTDVAEMPSAAVMEKARELGGFGFLDDVEPDSTTESGAKKARSERGVWGKLLERFMDRRFRCGVKIEWTGVSRTHRKIKLSRDRSDRNPTVTHES